MYTIKSQHNKNVRNKLTERGQNVQISIYL